MIVKELNHNFSNQKEAFEALFKNQDGIIEAKKSSVFKSCEKGASSVFSAELIESTKGLTGAKEGFIYPIVSSTNWFDSHKDVHFDGCFNKTIKEQQGKIKYVLDHELKYDSVIAWQKHIRMFKQKVDWSDLGKDYSGDTEALIFEIAKENIRRKDVLEDILNKVESFENSVRMVYFKVKLGLNSDQKQHKENKVYYEKKIGLIKNREEVEKDGYFWGVEELGIYKEASLVVAGGSNSATAIYEIEAVSNNTSRKWFY